MSLDYTIEGVIYIEQNFSLEIYFVGVLPNNHNVVGLSDGSVMIYDVDFKHPIYTVHNPVFHGKHNKIKILKNNRFLRSSLKSL